MNQLSNPDVASVMLILSAMSSLLLGGLVISRNPWRLTHRMFGALTLNLALWSIGVWLIVQSESEPAARFWIMATFAVASFLPATFYHFIVLFPHQRIEGRRWVLGFLYGGAITVSLGTLTPWYIRALEVFPDRPPQVTYGPVFSLFSVLVLVSMVFTFGNLIAKRRISSGIQRRQVENLLVSIYAATGLASITNVVGPMLQITSLELYGPSFVVLLMAGLAYAMVRYHLLDIWGLVSRTTVYAAVTGFVIITFLTTVSLAHWLVSTGGEGNELLSTTLAALAIVLLLQPLRERVQLFVDRLVLHRRYDAKALIARVSRVTTRFVDLESMLAEVARDIRQTVGVRSLRVYLISERDPEILHVAYSVLPEEQREDDGNHAFLIAYLRQNPETLSLEELLHGRPTEERTKLASHLAAMDTFLLLPLTTSSGLLGIVALGEKNTRDIYTVDDIRVLETLAGPLTGAIENNRLYGKIGDLNLHLQRIMSSMRGGVVAVDEKGVITTINEEGRELLGPVQMGDTLERLPVRISSLLRYTLDNLRGISDVEATLTGEDGQAVPVAMSSSCFLSVKGQLEGAMVLVVNMTQIKRLESNVQRADRLTSIGTMAAGMAHEVKNPLQSIKTFTQLLLERYDDSDFRKTFAEVVPPEVQRIDTIVSRLLDFARPRPIQFSPKDLRTTIQDVLALTENQLRKADVDVHAAMPPEPQTVIVDEHQMHQVFLNLVLNAIDAMSNRRERNLTIRIETCRTHLAQGAGQDPLLDVPCARVYVSDTGCGIDERDIGQLFNPFFTTKDDGCGLGLSVVHGLVKEHGGEIDVQSTLGEGTTFVVTLPLAGKAGAVERVGA
jgi:signal transduction histidine kinase